MKPTILNTAESLRTPDTAFEPDSRTSIVAGLYSASFGLQYREIEGIQLPAYVPEVIAIQFETARNLYLYAWHVYRFYPVALGQALFALELGLKMRLPERLPEPYQRRKAPHPMLKGLLAYAIDQGLLRNEGFRRWHEVAENRARERVSAENFKAMIEQQLSEMVLRDEPITVTPEDQSWNLVEVLRESLPGIRNELAHGSSMLTNAVRGKIELVAEILSQIYAPDLTLVRNDSAQEQ